MIVAQTILIAPIVAALSRQVLEDLDAEYSEQFRSLGLSRGADPRRRCLWDARYSLLTVASRQASAARSPRSARSSSWAATSTTSRG